MACPQMAPPLVEDQLVQELLPLAWVPLVLVLVQTVVKPPPAQLVFPTGGTPWLSVMLMAAINPPSVRSVQLFATLVPSGNT